MRHPQTGNIAYFPIQKDKKNLHQDKIQKDLIQSDDTYVEQTKISKNQKGHKRVFRLLNIQIFLYLKNIISYLGMI